MRRLRRAGQHLVLAGVATALCGSAAPGAAHAQGGDRAAVRMCAAAFGGLPPAVIRRFNDQHPRLRLEDVRFETVQNQTQAHDELVRLQRRKSRACDLYFLDVIWTAEFASRRWALDVTRIVDPMEDDFIPSALTTAEYRGRYFGVPVASDAGLLYYRTDRIATVPGTWQGVYESARANGGLVYQGSAYEGLTCDFLELAFAAGGSVLSADGRTSVIDSPQNLEALQLMVDGVRSGVTPSIVPFFFTENESFTAFFTGGPAYMRNWSYAYAFGKDTNFGALFDVVPLPAWTNGGRAGVLGGGNIAISRFGRNRRGAVAALRFLTSAATARLLASSWQTTPARTALYDDPVVQATFPFATQLREAIVNARSRPAHPRYPVLSAAIYENVNAALRGAVTPEVALQRADRRIERLLRR